MRNTLILAAIAAIAFASAAEAKYCLDPVTHHRIKCPDAARRPIKLTREEGAASPPLLGAHWGPSRPMNPGAPGGPIRHCNKAKPCGDTCIPMKDVCHKR